MSSESDELSKLLASVPVLRCPEGHAGHFAFVESQERFFTMEDSGKLITVHAEPDRVETGGAQILCGICLVKFDPPDHYELHRRGQTEDTV